MYGPPNSRHPLSREPTYTRIYTHIHALTLFDSFALSHPHAALRSELVGPNLAWEGNALGRFAARKPLSLELARAIQSTYVQKPRRRYERIEQRRGDAEFQVWSISPVSCWRNPFAGIQEVRTFSFSNVLLMSLKYVNVSTRLTKVSRNCVMYIRCQFLHFLYRMNSNCLLMGSEGVARYERDDSR